MARARGGAPVRTTDSPPLRLASGVHPTIPLLLVAVLLVVLVAAVRVVLTDGPTGVRAASVAALEPVELTARAADELERATAAGGAGVAFEVVQRSLLVAKPGGPLIPVPDAREPRTIAGFVPEYPLATYVETGIIVPSGFYAEIRRASDDDPGDGSPAATGPLEFATLVRDGRTWRTDGAGWYPTDHPPGIGLDPLSALLLPTLLRGAGDPCDAGAENVAGTSARALTATGRVADLPGIIAVDLAESTELRGPIRLAFDDAGRLVRLTVLARNTLLEEHDLMVETVITFSWPAAPPALPEPLPRYVEPADPDGED